MVDVFVDNQISGTIRRSQQRARDTLFRYLGPTSEAVSLTMPVVHDELAHEGLAPIFEMNLPEGILREELRNAFAKTLPQMDDLTLLAVVGQSQIGRLRCVPMGQEPRAVPQQSVAELLTYDGAEPLFAELMRRFMTFSGVAGVQPKVLVRDELERVTHRGTTHLVKAWTEKYPELAANEFYCLRVAQEAGLETAEVQLSDSGKLLVVRRFDLTDKGYLGFEDFCSLSAKTTAQKYEGSYERVAKRISQFVSPEFTQSALFAFFHSLVISCAVGNGDAHLKNFGVLYADTNSPVRFAPAFDIICTRAYLPADSLALTLAGSKRFPTRRTLSEFGIRSCGLALRQTNAVFEQTDGALAKVAQELAADGRRRPQLAALGGQMWTAWSAWLGERAPSISFPTPAPLTNGGSFSVLKGEAQGAHSPRL